MNKYSRNFLFLLPFSFLSQRLVTPQACKGGSNNLLAFLCVAGLLFAFSIANAIEVGGHLTEDTIWSPGNNPYLVTGVVYVDEDVTLTILPGTIVKFNATLLHDIGNDDFWFTTTEEPVAKMIRCEGRIIAEGTEQDSITFTRLQDIPLYHWGTIYLTENADLSIFKHCRIEYSAFTGFSLFEQIYGGISVYNSKAKIENCTFIDNKTGLRISRFAEDIIIKDSDFLLLGPLVASTDFKLIDARAWNSYDTNHILVAHNTFNSKMIFSTLPVYFVFNEGNYYQEDDRAIVLSSEYDLNYVFGNTVTNYQDGVRCTEETALMYIKKNNFIGGHDGVYIDAAYTEISDNYFEECDLYSGIQNTGKAYNNISNNGNFRLPGYLEVSNNISFNGNYVGVEVSWRNVSCNNNLTINNSYAIGSGGTVTYNNCVFIENEEINYFPISGNPLFRNCIIDFELEYPLIDGGGNIWVDSLQVQTLFEDITNGDFHLIEGSLAIDAGFDTLGYYYPFDLDYNQRVWDGDGNGSAIIDIGPYEYNSPSLGGIEGYTYNPITGEPVDYVLLKINNQPGEFTFSDSLGNFQYKLPAGVYDVYAERVFYEDVIQYGIEVFDGQFTQVLIPMTETVDAENIQYSICNFQLRNFPNPFNPSTTISFNLTAEDAENAEIIIYNIKGQKVKSFTNLQINKSPNQQIIWNGKDSNDKIVASGLYFYKLSSGKETQVKKMLLVK